MDLFEKITSVYSDLTSADFQPNSGSILLHDDGDGIQYLKSWNYSKPIPDGLKLGK
jgi:hypothetical protein